MADTVTFEAVLARLLRKQETVGHVSNADVRAAATLLGVHKSTVWRRLAEGRVRATRERYTLSDAEVAVLYACAGNAAETWRTLRRTGHWADGDVPSMRTFQRAALDRLDAQVLAGARDGRAGHDGCNPTIARSFTHRNEMWATDHKKLPLRVRDDNGEPSDVWFTELQDQHTRMVMGFLLTLTDATLEDNKELLAIAVEGAEHATDAGVVFVGGVPHTLHSDRGGDYIAWGASVGLIETGIERSFTNPYSPNANGMAESFHGWLEKSVCPQVPGYVHERYQHRNPDTARPSTDVSALLTIHELNVVVAQRMAEYNFERVHGTLGTTPFEAWCADPTPIHKGDPAAIRAAMRQQDRRTVDRGRIRFRSIQYTCADLSEVNGRRVAFRYLNSDTLYIDVDLGGRWVRAWDVNRMPDVEQARILSARAPRARAFNTRMNASDIARANLSRIAVDTAAAGFTPEEILAAQMALTGEEPAARREVSEPHQRRRQRAAAAADRATSQSGDDFTLPTPRIMQGRTHAS